MIEGGTCGNLFEIPESSIRNANIEKDASFPVLNSVKGGLPVEAFLAVHRLLLQDLCAEDVTFTLRYTSYFRNISVL